MRLISIITGLLFIGCSNNIKKISSQTNHLSGDSVILIPSSVLKGIKNSTIALVSFRRFNNGAFDNINILTYKKDRWEVYFYQTIKNYTVVGEPPPAYSLKRIQKTIGDSILKIFTANKFWLIKEFG